MSTVDVVTAMNQAVDRMRADRDQAIAMFVVAVVETASPPEDLAHLDFTPGM